MRREQRDQLAARQRRSVDTGATAGPGSHGVGAVQASPFSLYSDPLAAMDVTTADTGGAFTDARNISSLGGIYPRSDHSTGS